MSISVGDTLGLGIIQIGATGVTAITGRGARCDVEVDLELVKGFLKITAVRGIAAFDDAIKN